MEHDVFSIRALSKLLEAGLRMGEVTYAKSDKEAGTVIAQGISEGSKVAANTKIDLTVSGGKDYDPEKGLHPETKEETTKAPVTTKAPETTKAITNRDAARREVNDLTARIAAMEEATAAPETTTAPEESVTDDTPVKDEESQTPDD